MKIFKTRKSRLEQKIKDELMTGKPNINMIMSAVDEYEVNNLNTITKLRKERLVDSKKINGAIKQTILAHGPITKELIGSATKRIIGGMVSDKKTIKTNWYRTIMNTVDILLLLMVLYIIFK